MINSGKTMMALLMVTEKTPHVNGWLSINKPVL